MQKPSIDNRQPQRMSMVTSWAQGAMQGACSGFGLAVIALASVLIGSVIVVHVHVCLPILYPLAVSPVRYYASLLAMSWISFNVVFQYVCALSIDANQLPISDWEAVLEGIAAQQGGIGALKYCNVCAVQRLPRARHCFVCGTCVSRQDHHCPWVNACVGNGNMRYFFLFLFYLLLGTAFCGLQITHLKGLMGLRLGAALWTDASPSSPHVQRAFTTRQVLAVDSVGVLFVQILCAVIFVAMLGFVGWTGYLLVSNQTSMEYPSNRAEADRVQRVSSRNGFARPGGAVRFRPAYDIGWLHNVIQVFGTRGDWWTERVWRSPQGIPSRIGQALFVVWLTLPSLQPLLFNGSSFPQWQNAVRGGGFGSIPQLPSAALRRDRVQPLQSVVV